MDTFDRIWDRYYPIAVFIIFSGLVPLMIWSFFAQHEGYKKDYSGESWYEKVASQDKAMIKEVINELEAHELHSVEEREDSLPPQIYNPEDNNFSIPLEQLLEGNHGRFL